MQSTPLELMALISLVGAGPGDPELLTVRAVKRLQAADCIYYDELVDKTILEHASPTAELVYVGKKGGCHSLDTAAVCALMAQRVREGRRVVRLKGGDPFVFGRACEEIQQLQLQGVTDWEVVPGVSAGIAAPGLAAIPLTHKGVSTRVILSTGHKRGEDHAEGDTHVIFMGLQNLPALVQNFLSPPAGSTQPALAPSTPVAIVENASLPSQKVVTGTLASIVADAAAAAVGSLCVIVVGEAVGLRRAILPQASPSTLAPAAAANWALVVLAHGSKAPTWKAAVERLVARLEHVAPVVAAAYYEMCPPDLPTVLQSIHSRGIKHIVIVPYFLSPGKHLLEDIPALVKSIQATHPDLVLHVTDCLQDHPAVQTAVISRAQTGRVALLRDVGSKTSL
eukprot:TRINITY_DN12022_c0_g1_i1.p2 TRINITY_DN12022_c0_g1~~TRINITY_DN12022_c0_g1_i1.p2  ORF type:complete len:395 (-),score=82.05 TRINITY_DN12022_c0_g1_i1:13-1197(-)